MPPSVLAALGRGATIVTPGRRLSRRLRRLWNRRQRTLGFTVWSAADILPWGAWLERSSRELLYSGVAREPLLSPLQERILWERTIERSPHGGELLRADAAAGLASQAWALLHDWRLPLDNPAFDSADDPAVFRDWAREYASAPFLDSARLADLVVAQDSVCLFGFDELTPRQRAFGTLTPVARQPGNAVRTTLPDAEAEMEAAALWARGILLSHPDARIGIVVPQLESARARLERVFSAALDPSGDATPVCHIALGPPLSNRPAVHAALTLLEALQPRLPLSTLTSILLSPWIAGAGSERSARAMFDARLRREGSDDCSLRYVASHKYCPVWFAAMMEGCEQARAGLHSMQSPSAWSRTFSDLLTGFGWPGEAALSSVEFQTVEAFRGALSGLASLDAVTSPVSAGAAVALLGRIASEARFQPEDLDQPVQILGMLDASTEEFDHLWILSLDDETWPPAASPNPFLPAALLHAHDIPHSSAGRELEFARRITGRLLSVAPNVVVSSAGNAGERELQPSPLIAHLPFEARPDGERPWYFVPAALETLVDVQAPPLPEDSAQTGGTRTLQLQAACPFRAFAELRLMARRLESPRLGLDPRDRGTLLHAALRYCWIGLVSQRRLVSTSREELRAIIERSVSRALRDAVERPASAFLERLEAVEYRRLTSLLEDWLEIERGRPMPFTVLPPEQPREIEVGGLRLNARIDRIDQLDDGLLVVIDYKSTAPSLAAWEDDRPDQPQLPLYAISTAEALAAVAFAQVKTGDSFFRGYGGEPPALPGLKSAEIDDLLDSWRAALIGLAEAFREGKAAVDPKDGGTCAYCHLHTLCRIYESV